jgi:predicted membrane protein
MSNVAGYSPRGTVSNSSVGSGSGGGGVEDILKRLGNVEAQVSAIPAIIPHLATKADVADIPQLATKADVAALETAIIKWIIATVLASAALAFTIAKLVH